MKKPFKEEQLVDQRNALTLYLQALLNEVDAADDDSVVHDTSAENESALAVPIPVQPTQAAPPGRGDARDQAETPSEIISSSAPVAYSETPILDNADTTNSNAIIKQHEPPQWALPRVQVLTFSLGSMEMAAPLDKLNGIIPFPERLTALPGQSHWFLGLARNRNQNVQVIDLADAILPQHRQQGSEDHPAGGRYILLIDGGRWGVLCNRISTVLTLEPQQVHWQRSRRVDFILGTVIDHMQSVLCVDSLISRLNSGRLV